MDSKQVLISGYYGFDNFGDDAILQVIVSNLKKSKLRTKITAISNNPLKIKINYHIDSVYTFNFTEIIEKLKKCDLFISGGGSLLQNATSTKSLLYYLILILLAKLLGKKVFVYAQGVGPVNGFIQRFLTCTVLKTVNQITVRDEDSLNLLEGWGLKAIKTSDPVWNLDLNQKPNHDDNKIKVGIQLREWQTLDDNKLKILAEAVKTHFNPEKYAIIIIPLQEDKDYTVCRKLKIILQDEFGYDNAEIASSDNISGKLKILNSLDFLIGMRFHACLITIKAGIPTLALSYDPKVKSLAVDSCCPYINIEDLDKNILIEKFSELEDKAVEFSEKLTVFSNQKALVARQTDDLLIKLLLE